MHFNVESKFDVENLIHANVKPIANKLTIGTFINYMTYQSFSLKKNWMFFSTLLSFILTLCSCCVHYDPRMLCGWPGESEHNNTAQTVAAPYTQVLI